MKELKAEKRFEDAERTAGFRKGNKMVSKKKRLRLAEYNRRRTNQTTLGFGSG